MTLQVLAPTVIGTDPKIEWNPVAAPTAVVTLTKNLTFDTPVLQAGGTFMLYVKQDATGGRTITWASTFKWPGGTAPTLSTGANAVDIIAFACDGTYMYGVPQLNFS